MIDDPKTLAKAQTFWKAKAELRQQPGNCRRCGHPNADAPEYRTCPRCRGYIARKKDQYAGMMVPRHLFNAVLRRINSLEHAVAGLQFRRNEIYNRGYNKGRHLRIALNRRAHYLESYQPITHQELSTINHAFAHS